MMVEVAVCLYKDKYTLDISTCKYRTQRDDDSEQKLVKQ